MGSSLPVHTAKRLQRGSLCSCEATNTGSGSSSSERLTCQQRESVFDELPVEIVHHIHSFLPLRDAARAAGVSRAFRHSWTCYPNLTLCQETLGLTHMKCEDRETFLIDIVGNILTNHSGIGVQIFRLNLYFCKDKEASYLDRWLQIVVRSGIKELSLTMPACMKKMYNFPCSLLSDEVAAGSVEFLSLDGCAFRPTTAIGCFRRLRRLHLYSVDITDEGLGHLLLKSFALEQMDIFSCNKIIFLSLPCTLQKLKFLRVSCCLKLQSVDINAPHLSTFDCRWTIVKEISVVGPSQLKDVHLSVFLPSHTLSVALARLPVVAQNLESLSLFSLTENFNIPMLVSKFTCLKKLEIKFQGSVPLFDVLSLVSTLDALPSLGSFILHLGEDALSHDDSVLGGEIANYLRWKPRSQLSRLRNVKITGFSSAKNLIQFVIYILESAPSLECLTLDTIPWKCRICIDGKKENCCRMNESRRAEARRAVKATERYIVERVPSGVRLQVVEPCSCCHIR